jgi:hypothetical protein
LLEWDAEAGRFLPCTILSFSQAGRTAYLDTDPSVQGPIPSRNQWVEIGESSIVTTKKAFRKNTGARFTDEEVEPVRAPDAGVVAHPYGGMPSI